MRLRRGPLERVLSVVTDVRAGEAPVSLALTLNVFLLLTAYYVIKPVREALILELESGAEYKSYLSGAIALVLLVAVPAYARLVDRLPRLLLVTGVTLFFASHLALFFVASQFESLRGGPLGATFYVWVGLFNLMVVAQLWSFANDLLDRDQGKRLFPLVALGASLGAVLGSSIAGVLVEPLGVYPLLLVSAAILGLCALLYVAAERAAATLARRAQAAVAPGGAAPEPAAAATPAGQGAPPHASGEGAFELVFRHRYLLAIALFTLVYTWVNTNGEYILSRVVKAAAVSAVERGELAGGDANAFIGRTYAQFFLGVNVLGLALQSLVVSRVVKYGGIALSMLVLPIIALGSGLFLLVTPVLAIIRVGKTLENATDYSLNSTVRQMLWLPTSPAMKYKAKQAVDTFFVRMGDVSSALLVYVGAGVLAWSVRPFAFINVLLVGVWLALVALILREGQRLELSRASEVSRAVPAPARASAAGEV